MDVDQPLTEFDQHGQRRGRPIDELPVRARGGEGAFDDELLIHACSIPLASRNSGTMPGKPPVSNTASTEQLSAPLRISPPGPFSQHQTERPNDHRLAGAVSPVITLSPGGKSMVSRNQGKFLIRSVLNIPNFVLVEFGCCASVEQNFSSLDENEPSQPQSAIGR